MFDLFLHLFTVVCVLAFFGRRSTPVHSPAAAQRAAEPTARLSPTFTDEVKPFQRSRPKTKSKRFSKRVSIAAIAEMNSTQIRQLCKRHKIPVSTRGRVSQATIAKLREVVK